MSSLMDTKFSCFFEISFLGVNLNDAVSNTILLETSHEDVWHWLLNLPIPIQSARLWRELSINVNKSYQSFPRVRTNQSQPLMALNILVTQLLSSYWWFCPSLTPDVRTTNIWTQIQAHYILFLKFGVSQISTLRWFCWSLVFNFLRTSLYWIYDKVFILGHQVFVLLRDEFPRCRFMNDEASYTILLETFQAGFWHWLLNLLIVIQCACLWRELSFSVNKSCQSFPPMNCWVSDCIWTQRSQLSSMALTVFSTQLLLLGVLLLSVRNSSNSCHQDLKTLNSISFVFLNFDVPRISSFEMISCIIGFQNLQVFFCFEAMERSSCLDTNFLCFLEIFCEVPLQMMKLVILARLLKTFHQDFWICLLNFWPMRKSLTRTVFWCEQVLSKLPYRVGINQSQPLITLKIFGTQLLLLGVMILSIFNSPISCHQDH